MTGFLINAPLRLQLQKLNTAVMRRQCLPKTLELSDTHYLLNYKHGPSALKGHNVWLTGSVLGGIFQFVVQTAFFLFFSGSLIPIDIPQGEFCFCPKDITALYRKIFISYVCSFLSEGPM